MVESRAKRLQVVLMLAERKEQEAGQQLSQQRALVTAEEQQLRELDEYAKQYLQNYAARKIDIRPHELIAYSSFIQRLGEACKEQQVKVERLIIILDKIQLRWRTAHHKCEAIKELILRLEHDENLLLDKRLQKELDDLTNQQYSRKEL
ncbi:MAG: flagellar export protein FliJ [Pseudomonadota bacterium]